MHPLSISFVLLSSCVFLLSGALLVVASRLGRLERQVNWLLRKHSDRPPSRYPLPSTDVSRPFTHPLP